MAEEIVYDEQVDNGESPNDPLGLRGKSPSPKKDPLGLRKPIPESSKKELVNKTFRFDPSKMPRYSGTENIFGEEATSGKISTPQERELSKKVQQAQQIIANELINPENKGTRTRIIQQRKYEDYQKNIPLPTSDMPKTGSSVTAERVLPSIVNPKQQDFPVSEEEHATEAVTNLTDENSARNLLNKVGKENPAKQKEIERSIYELDAARNIIDDPNSEKRADKILKNSKDIQSGKLKYDIQNSVLLKPENTWQSAVTGWKEKNKAFDDFSFILSAPKEKIIEEYEKRRTNHDPDAPIAIPENKMAEYGHMAGVTPLKSIIGSLATAAIPGAQEFVPVVSSVLGSYDYSRMAISQTFEQIYNELRNKGVASDEAYDKALYGGVRAAGADAANVTALSFIGPRISGVVPRSVITQGVRQAMVSGLKNAGINLSKDITEGLLGGFSGAFAQEYKNWVAQTAGVDRQLDEGVIQQIEGNLVFTLGIAAASKAGKELSKPKYWSFLNALSKVDEGRLTNGINEMVQTGKLTEQEGQTAKKEIEGFKKIDNQIPSNVSEESRIKIQDKIRKRSDLESQLEATDKAFHPEIKEKIKKNDEEIVSLSKGKTKITPEQRKSQKTIDTAIEEGKLSGMNADIAKSDPEAFLSMIADQAFGRTATGEISDIANAEYAVRKEFGDDLVNTAKELFPLKEKVTSVAGEGKVPPENIEGISVSEHGEDTKTAEKKENGIQYSKLSEVGKTEAKEIGDKIIEANQNKIITSKVERAKETGRVAAEEVKNKTGKDIPIEETEILNTWDIGEYDGKPEGTFNEKEWIDNPTDAPEGGENFNSFKSRMEDAFRFVKSQQDDVHVVTHSKVMRALQALEETGGVWDENTTQKFLELKEQKVGEISPVQEQLNALQGSYDRLIKSGESATDPDMVRMQEQINNLKTQQNAETIRSNQGQVRRGGDELRRSPDTSSENIQFNEGQEPVITETEQQTRGGEEGKVANEEKIIAEGDGFILRFKDLDDVASEFGLNPVEPRTRKSDVTLKENAMKKINSWLEKGSYDKNISSLMRTAERGKGFTDEDNVILSFHIASLRGMLRGMDIESPEYDGILNQLERAKEAGQIARSTAGAALRVPTTRANPIEEIGEAMIAKMEANSVDKLTNQQKEEVQRQVKKYKEASDLADQKTEELSDAVNKKKAEEVIKNTKPSKKKKTAEEYKAERAAYMQAAKDAIKKATSGESGLMAVPLPYLPQLIAAAPHIKNIMVSLVEEGITKLDDIVKTIHGEFKDVINGVTEKDIQDVIAGVYAEKKTPLSDLQRQLRDLQTEARLINDIASIENGESAKIEKQQREVNQRVKQLRDQLKDLRKRIAVDEKEAESFYEEEIDDTAKSLMRIKNRNIAKQEEILQKIKDKDFSGPEEKYSILDDPNVKKNYPTLRKEALDAIAAKEDAQHEFNTALYKDELARQSFVKKSARTTGDVLHTSKALLSGIDDSASFVQNSFLVLTNPIAGGKAWIDHWKDAFNPKRFKRELAAIHNSKDWEIIRDSGLDVLEPQSLAAGKAEEAFERNMLARIKMDIKGIPGEEFKPWEHTGGIFERAFTSLGNNIRINLFRQQMANLLKENKTFHSHPEEYKALARAINELTGRGKMAPSIEAVSSGITPVIWAPKMLSSTLNLLGLPDFFGAPIGRKGLYRQLTPTQRKFLGVQMAKGIGLGILVMSAASLGGAQVDYDPRSVTFGDVKVGHLSYNVFGRFSSVVKTLVQFVLSQKKLPEGKIREYDTGKFGSKNSWEIIGGFTRGKLTPFAGILYDLKAGKKYFTNEPYGLKDVPLDLITPMSIQDLISGLENDGAWSLLTRFLPAFEGIKVSDDRDFEKIKSETKKRHKSNRAKKSNSKNE